MSRYTGHASLQELLGRAGGNGGYGGGIGFGNGDPNPLLLSTSSSSPTSPKAEARARALLPPQVAEALYGGDGDREGGGGKKRPREEDHQRSPPPPVPPRPPTAPKEEEEGGNEGGDRERRCPVCGRALALFASSAASFSSDLDLDLDLDAVNRHVDACLIASRRKGLAAAAAAKAAAKTAAASGKSAGKKIGKQEELGQRQASLLGMRKVVRVKREEQQQEEEEEEAAEQEDGEQQPAAPPSSSSPSPAPAPLSLPLPPPLLSLPPLSETCFESRLVSRRHAAANAPPPSSSSAAAEPQPPPLSAGTVVSLLRERSNAADDAAVRAVAFPGAAGSLGYLPSGVAAKLAQVLDDAGGGCAATATLCEGVGGGGSRGGGGGFSSLRVRVEVILPIDENNCRRDHLLRLVAAAAEAALEDSARSSSGPGGRLLCAALPALDAALTPREEGGDAHLFSAGELSVLGALRGKGAHGVPPEAAALFLRVFSSRRPFKWVRPSKLAAAAAAAVGMEAADQAARAALALVRAGLAVPVAAVPGERDGENGENGSEVRGEEEESESENALLAAADALTVDELRAALLSFSKENSSASASYSSPLSASALRRMGRADLLALAARALRRGGRPASSARGMTAALLAALAAAPPAASSSSSLSPSSPLLPAFRLKTAAMLAVRRCERAAFLSEGVTFATVAAAASGGMRSLPRYRSDGFLRLGSGARAAVPPAFASRAEFLDYERSIAEAAALDDALNASLAASTPAERAAADAAVEAAMAPCVDFVTRRRRQRAVGGGGGDGSAAAAAGTKKENAPPAAATPTEQNDLSSSCPPPRPQPQAAAPSFLVARFSALGVRLACATASAAWLEGKRRRAEADEVYWGCLGVTAPLSSSSSPPSRSDSSSLDDDDPNKPFFCFRRRGHWWTRLALNAEASGRPSQALELVEAALADDEHCNVSWGDRLGLMRRGHRRARPPRRWRAPPAAWAAAAAREPRERVLVAATIPQASSSFPSSSSASAVTPNPNAKSVFEGGLTVEKLALDFYSRPENGGWKGAHAEGGVWGCLFRALFHDVMFPPSSSSSFTSALDTSGNSSTSSGNVSSKVRALSMLRVPCQRYPLDFGSPLFYELRKAEIDALLARLRAADAEAVARMVSAAWDRGLGPYAAGGTEGRWNSGGGGGGSRGGSGREELRELCGCLGGRALAAVLELFAKGVAREGGMPDLVLWRRRRSGGGGEGGGGRRGRDDDCDDDSGDEKGDLFGEAMVVEVKGPRDRLSDNQRAWLAAFEDRCGIEAEVLKVVEPGSRKAVAAAAAGSRK